MIAGTLEIGLPLDGCRSLKDKRQIVRSLLDRLRRDLHVSAAEVGDNDLWTSALLGVATVGNNARTVESALQKAVDMIDAHPEVEIESARREIQRS